MKKILSVFLILSAILVIAGCSSNSKKSVGIYHCPNWRNGGEAVIMLNEDGSCDGPFAYPNLTWQEKGDIITAVEKDNEKNIETMYIVDEGIVYGSHFFRKLK